jgi:Na+-transporting NADH:ubiquinone oxidoreductase subunit NqrB
MTTSGGATLRIGDRRIPVILPSLRDPRLHTAAVIISIHILGITVLGFHVSVPQILSAVIVSALIDVGLTLGATGSLVWPASGMLTGSGVALILRLTGMPAGDYWSWDGWYYFAGVAAVSVLTKYLIKHRGTHLFNPSNLGLVAAFLVLGRTVIEPLDFWWAPFGFWMALAYLIIVVGGVLITRRLRLFALAMSFWASLAAGLGILAASGHCFTASWSLTPVCDGQFWWVVMTSPEILIFMFFMITDPKTIPRSPASRIAFGLVLGVLCAILMAPQTIEFGAKVALLSGLVILSPLRFVFDRVFEPGVGAVPDELGRVPAFWRGAVTGSLVVLLATAVVLAGVPARRPALAASVEAAVPVVPTGTALPEVSVDPEVETLNGDVDPDVLALALAEDLGIEGEAVKRVDGSLLISADGGLRLVEMQQRVDDAIATNHRTVDEYRFDSLHLVVADDQDTQSGALGLVGSGTVDHVTYDPDGSESARSSSSFDSTFVLAQVGGERWLIVDVVPTA